MSFCYIKIPKKFSNLWTKMLIQNTCLIQSHNIMQKNQVYGKNMIPYNLQHEEWVGAETRRNLDVAWKISAIELKDDGFKEKLTQMEQF